MSTRRYAVIRGTGLATPLGASLDETWDKLLAGRFIRDHALVPVRFGKGENRAVRLAVQVAHEAIRRSRWTAGCLADDATALIVGTSKGPIESWMTPLLHMPDNAYVAGELDLAGLAQVAAVVGDELRLGHGPRMTLSAACASGLEALIRGAMMIEAREAERVLVVATESSVHPLFMGSFRRLGVLPPDGIGCRPFDHARRGFLMSEAAAAVCLEASDTPDGTMVDRYAFGGDATHLTGGDPAGTTLRRLIAHVIDGRPVDLVHAHGTGTDANDPLELAAIESSLPASTCRPVLYSHKGALGHSLGAAGLVATVITRLIHDTGRVPGNVCTTHPLPTQLQLSVDVTHRCIRRSVMIASGFGGAMACVSLREA